MSKDPAFMFYSADFLIGVMDMTMEERGQYISLMCLQHQKGHLSIETIRLLVGCASDKVLSKFSVDENGLYYNERLDEEIHKRAKFVKSRQENGAKGGRPKQEETDRFSVGFPTNNLHEDEDVNGDESARGNDFENGNGKNSVPKLPPCPYEKIKNLFNSICISFPQIRSIDGERKKAVGARWAKYRNLDVFEQLFTKAQSSSFLKGESESNWRATFDWLMKPNNMSKTLEGNFDDRPTAHRGTTHQASSGALSVLAKMREECGDD